MNHTRTHGPRALRRRPPGGRRDGGALALALIAVMSVSVLGAGYLQVSSAVTRRQVGAIDNKRAFYLAEAGLAEAYAGIRVGRSGNVGTPEAPAAFGNGLLWVDADEDAAGRVRLDSTGLCGSGRVTLSLVVRRGRTGFEALGVFSQGSLTVREGTVIDAFDSREGPYAPPAGAGERDASPGDGLFDDPLAAPRARVGSNQDIHVHSSEERPTVLHADLVPGPQHAVHLHGDPEVTGSTAPRSEPTALPRLELPAVPDLGPLEHAGDVPRLLSPGDAGYDALRVAARSELVVQGPARIVVRGPLTLEPGASLVLDTTGGEIELYVQGEVLFAAGSNLSTTEEDTTRVALALDGAGAAQLDAAARFHGTLFAPGREVSVGAAFEVFGAVATHSLVLAEESRVHYDRALGVIAAQDALPDVLTWRIVELSTAVPRALGGDPFQALGVDPLACVPPADAHEDALIEVQYLSLLGVPLTYRGLESAFDWADVRRVDFLVRSYANHDTQVVGG